MKILQQLLPRYSLSLIDILPVQKGYRNKVIPFETVERGRLALIIYKNEPEILNRIKNANCVSSYLAEQGYPVRSVMANDKGQKIVRVLQGDNVFYAGIYQYLPGETIPWEAYTKKHIKQLGQMMSNMHYELMKLETRSLNEVTVEMEEQIDRMVDYFNLAGVRSAMRRKLGVTVRNSKFEIRNSKLIPQQKVHGERQTVNNKRQAGSIWERFRKLFKVLSAMPQQPLHMDFVRGNVLFLGRESELGNQRRANGRRRTVQISGIIDFEKVASGPVVIDIARTYAFLLVDCKYKSSRDVTKYFLYSGYNKRGKNQLPDLKLMNALVGFFLIYDFYKFLRHNPYESLHVNEHFRRTTKFLIKLGILVRI